MENSVKIEKKILNSVFLECFLNKKDVYGEKIIEKTLNKLRYVTEISDIFNFDTTVANAIMVGYDISRSCYDEIIDEFYEKVNLDLSKIKYVKTVIKNILQDIESAKVDIICNGIENVINGTFSTPEEQIVDIVNYGYDFVDSIEDNKNRGIAMVNYVDEVIQKSTMRKALVAIAIPTNNIKKREKLVIENKTILLEKYEYFFENYNLIPETFKHNLKGLSDKEIVAYFITMGE